MSLVFPYKVAPEYGTATEVAPGVYWLAMPLGMELNVINLYMLEDVDGWYIVDTGLSTSVTRQHWQTLFANGLGDKPVKGVIVTHLHPDHMGNAQWLTEQFKVPLLMSQGEYSQAGAASFQIQSEVSWQESDYYRSAGISADILEKVSQGMHKVGTIDVPGAFQRLRGGGSLTINGHHWQILIGRGHSSEHVCLFCPALEVLISGDHILPKITPNVSVWPMEPLANPLADYLETLQQFKSLPEQTLVLPAHNLPFRDVSGRVDQLTKHHQSQLKILVDACLSPMTAVELMPLLFRRELKGFNFVMALGECIAHLNYLVAESRLFKRKEADGVLRYSVQKG